MSKENIKRWIKLILAVVCMLALWFAMIWKCMDYQRKESAIILMKLIDYHVLIRIFIGIITNHLPLSAYHPKLWFYQEKAWEKKLYQSLKVKRWKNHMPIFDERKWDIRTHSVGEILRFGCQAEADHWGNILGSWLSLCLTSSFGLQSIGLVAFTAVTAGGFDFIFVLIQRFNRPRLVSLMKRQEHRVEACHVG